MQAITLTLAALAALTPAIRASGVEVINKCDFPVYLWSVADQSSDMYTIAEGKTYSADYESRSEGGVSIKISTTESAKAVTQLEYTLEPSTVWYDLSNINGYPFSTWGMDLAVSDDSCPQIACAAGVEKCADVYNVSDDNTASKSCDATANTTLTLCNGGSDAAKLMRRHGHGLRHGIRPATY